MPEEIHVLDKKVRLLQPDTGFRTGLDSVMLAAACPAADFETVLDIGCGVGGAAFSLLYRERQIKLTGVDLQPVMIELAQENAKLNKLEAQCNFIQSDIRNFTAPLFDHVICNPPYLEAATHVPSPDAGLAMARGHQSEDISLEDWVKAAHRLVKSNGSFTLIHRADQLDRIIHALGKMFGKTDIIPLWPKAGEPANRVIVRTWKDKRSPITLLPGLIRHEEDGSYTKEAQLILREGKAFVTD
ncbi:MAG: methyltransferase domain-containing protein [Alphaproteobacteria bacterium]|nr:methyltransferase domain-containing protein [Alphaproteobacteria bacterium]